MMVSVVCLEAPVVFSLETRIQSSKVNCVYNNMRILCHLCEFCTFCVFKYCFVKVHGFRARA